MALISQRSYAKQRGLTHEAVRKRTVEQGGVIPTYGPQKQLDPEEADQLWAATMKPSGASQSRWHGPAGAAAAPACAPELAARACR